MQYITKALLVIIISFMLGACTNSNSSRSSFETKIEVIDSIALNPKEFVYWYRLDRGIYGYSECKLAASSGSNMINDELDVFFISDYITNIYINSPKQILIELYYDDFRIIDINQPKEVNLETRLGGDPQNSYRFRLK